MGKYGRGTTKCFGTLEERLAAHRTEGDGPDACWVWGSATNGTYGTLTYQKRKLYAHRVAWEVSFGPIPEGQFVLHRCDNTLCVRPNHLFLGTQKHNIHDCMIKGRDHKHCKAVIDLDSGEWWESATLCAKDIGAKSISTVAWACRHRGTYGACLQGVKKRRLRYEQDLT